MTGNIWASMRVAGADVEQVEVTLEVLDRGLWLCEVTGWAPWFLREEERNDV